MLKTSLKSNDIFLESSRDIRHLSSSLERIGITHFTYLKTFRDDSQIYLSSDAKWIEDYYGLQLYKSSLFEKKQEDYQSGFYAWDPNDDSDVFLHGKKYFNTGNGMTIIQKNNESCEFYFFSGNLSDQFLINRYLNDRDLFKKFSVFFNSAAKKIIHEAEKDKIHINNKENFKQKIPMLDQKIREEFIREISSSKYNTGLFRLTYREREIISLILDGKTTKNISNILYISPKTVDRHLENIKEKLECENKVELIKKLLLEDNLVLN